MPADKEPENAKIKLPSSEEINKSLYPCALSKVHGFRLLQALVAGSFPAIIQSLHRSVEGYAQANPSEGTALLMALLRSLSWFCLAGCLAFIAWAVLQVRLERYGGRLVLLFVGFTFFMSGLAVNQGD